jgi:hypothetical protein
VLIDDVKNARVERVLDILAIGKFVNDDPSPINLPKTDPVEIVEKNPYVVDIEATEILLATIKFVDIVVTERPASTVVPPVCVILLAAVSIPPTPSVPVFEVAWKKAPAVILEKTPLLEIHPALQILEELIWFVDNVFVDTNGKRPAATVLLTVVRLLLTVIKPALSPPPPVAPIFNHFPGCPA